MLTLVDFLAAYREALEALIERLLNLGTDLLAFSSIFFAYNMIALFNLLNNLNVDDDDTQ